MTAVPRPGRWRRRPGAALAAIGTIAVTLAVATALRPVRLSEVLLLVLVEVIGVALVAGPATAAATAVGAFVAVNFLLVPPYGTLAISVQENWITLAVFLLLAVGASSLVNAVVDSERHAAAASAREAALAEALRPDEASAAGALSVFRSALDLEVAALIDPAVGRVLLATGTPPQTPASLTVDVPPGLQVRGWGSEVLGTRRTYLTALATAAVRAWESEQLAAEQERAARLAEIDAARSALLASIGHDLRTPLSGIRISADALAMAGPDLAPADRDSLLDGLRQSALRLDELLSAVLDAARIEAGVASVRHEQVDLRGVVDQALADFETDRLVATAPEHPVPATTDPVLVERIVANLVANALAHTPDGTLVEVSCGARPDDSAEIRVVDHGPGLAGGVADAVDVGRNPHGMGLLIVDRLAGFAGVDVVKSATPGGGLTVTLRLGVAA